MVVQKVEGPCFNHLSIGVTDVKSLTSSIKRFPLFSPSAFMFGFELVETPQFDLSVVQWLVLPTGLHLLLIQNDINKKLPEGTVLIPKNIRYTHHLCFSVSEYDAFIQNLKEKTIEVYEQTQPDGKTKQTFFYDIDGNELEVGSWESLNH